MSRSINITLVFLLVSISLLYAVNATEVIIVNQTVEKIYSIESLTLSGDLETNSLSLTGNGEVISGDNVKVYLLGPSSDILIKDLKVNDVPTTVSFDSRGYFFLTKENKFSLQATVDIRTIGQIYLNVPGPVNKLHFDLQHGYALDGDKFGLVDNVVVIQRTAEISKLVNGEFKFTYADINEFFYVITLRAFGGDLGRYSIDLKNNEQIRSVNGAMKWEQDGSRLTFDLKGSEATVAIQGIFDSNNLQIPIQQGRVLIEADSEKKLILTTPAREIDISEVSISPKYNNARAFLLNDYDSVSVFVQLLGLKPSLTATVNRAENRVAITATGSILGETNYYYSNTGVEYLKLNVDGTPLYAATNYQPVKLTEDEGNLLLSFPKVTNGQLTFSYFSTRSTLLPVDVISIPLVRSDLPISEENTEIFLPKGVFVLETFGVRGGSELPSIKTVIIFSSLMLLLGYLLIGQRNIKFVFSFFVFATGAYLFDIYFFLLVVAVSLLLIIKKHTNPDQFKKILIIGGGIVLVALIVLGATGILGSLFSYKTAYESDYVASGDAMIVERAVAPAFQGLQKIGEGEGAITVPTKEGVLPVQMQIPDLGKSIRVTNHLVTKEHPTELKVLVISEWFVYIFYLIALGYGIKTYSLYTESSGIKSKTRK